MLLHYLYIVAFGVQGREWDLLAFLAVVAMVVIDANRRAAIPPQGLDESFGERCLTSGTVAGVHVGCFPDLYGALAGNMPDQVITL